MRVESHPCLLESDAQEVVVSQHQSLFSKLAAPGEVMLTEPKLPASSMVGSNQWLVGEFKGPVLCIQVGPLCGGIYDPPLTNLASSRALDA